MVLNFIFLLVLPHISFQQSVLSGCPCTYEQLHNKKCDDECDIDECDFDNGSCDSSSKDFSYLDVIIISCSTVGVITILAVCCYLSTKINFWDWINNIRRHIIPDNDGDHHITKRQLHQEASLFIYTENVQFVGEPTCAICLMDFKRNDSVRITKCKHMFHMNCIEQWLVTARRPKCPDCNKEYISNEFFE
ncbi:unnamed protein product [Blepharisma stoltei]|uniref:RING-type domain-containing protein n=1 Tax=Blepharisma stoltei TaxID=1481888 RepID=A0AAU9JTJ6_9CILI|nr:unnamed protein product [Blepharisma stoltei]